ncbi:MAG TPA: hypothetical protein DIS90_10345, partial [Cytophagales bacterium]|nr:hypothetical protein [Cytophagales bacterium]
VGVPLAGVYREALNSDAFRYGGGGGLNGELCALPVFHMGQAFSLILNLPPLTGVVLVLDPAGSEEEMPGEP